MHTMRLHFVQPRHQEQRQRHQRTHVTKTSLFACTTISNKILVTLCLCAVIGVVECHVSNLGNGGVSSNAPHDPQKSGFGGHHAEATGSKSSPASSIVDNNNEQQQITTTHQHKHPQQQHHQQQNKRCQEITIPMCKTIRYNYTEMPNSFNHETQEEAGLEVHQYWPLVEIKCSDDLKFFICSLYVPICMEDYPDGTVPPCRSVCERARAGCEPVMTQYGFFWPERMVCDQFPKFGKHSICMDEKGGELPSNNNLNLPGPNSISSTHHNTGSSVKHTIVSGGVLINVPSATNSNHNSKEIGGSRRGGSSKTAGGASSHHHNMPPIRCRVPGECTCEYPLVRVDKHAYLPIQGFRGGGAGNSRSRHANNTVAITTGTTPHCAFPCRGYGYSSPDEIRFASYWLTFWSGVTCSLSTVTILTFLIDSTRFNYPERPIICISFCYVFVSLGYLTRIYAGHAEVACGGSHSPVVRYPGLLVTPFQTNSPVCTVVFLLTYYFTVAGSCWYVVLTITWYLASVLKWGTEAISEKSGVFHAVVWVSSAIITLVVLLTDSIDGDSISGICFVGNQDYWNLVVFVLAPMGGLLGLGSVFLVSGFVALLRIRTVIAREVRNFHKLEKLMIRIGVFGGLYSVNVVAVLGGFVYEAWVRDEWVKAVNCGGDGGGGGSGNHSSNCVEGVDVSWKVGGVQGTSEFYKPAYSVLMIKYFMSLATGITSSIWVFSSKTIETWRRFFYSHVLFLCFPSACSSRNTGSSSLSGNSNHTTSILTTGGGGGGGIGNISTTNTHHHHLHLHHQHTSVQSSKQTHV